MSPSDILRHINAAARDNRLAVDVQPGLDGSAIRIAIRAFAPEPSWLTNWCSIVVRIDEESALVTACGADDDGAAIYLVDRTWKLTETIQPKGETE